jgi:hypothetical protein
VEANVKYQDLEPFFSSCLTHHLNFVSFFLLSITSCRYSFLSSIYNYILIVEVVTRFVLVAALLLRPLPLFFSRVRPAFHFALISLHFPTRAIPAPALRIDYFVRVFSDLTNRC